MSVSLAVKTEELTLTPKLLDKSVCQVVALPSDELNVNIYFDTEAKRATTEAIGKNKEFDNALMTIFLDLIRIDHPVQRVLGRLDMSALYVMNLLV